MDDDAEMFVLAEMTATATMALFWQSRAAHLKGSPQGEFADEQAAHFADLIRFEELYNVSPETDPQARRLLG